MEVTTLHPMHVHYSQYAFLSLKNIMQEDCLSLFCFVFRLFWLCKYSYKLRFDSLLSEYSNCGVGVTVDYLLIFFLQKSL